MLNRKSYLNIFSNYIDCHLAEVNVLKFGAQRGCISFRNLSFDIKNLRFSLEYNNRNDNSCGNLSSQGDAVLYLCFVKLK